MMEIAAKTGRRLQDVLVSWQENRDWRNGGKQQQADLRRSRMTCSEKLPDVMKTQDWTGTMGVSPSGRFRVVEQPAERTRLLSRDGIQWNAGKTVLIMMAGILAAVLLAEAAVIGIGGKSIERLENKIQNLSEKNSQLESQLAYSSGDITVCTEAVKLNLISSNGAKTVRLMAPQNATMTFTAATAQQQDTDEKSAQNAGD